MSRFLTKIFQKREIEPVTPSDLKQLQKELNNSLENLLDAWYPASFDLEQGGFYTDLNYKFEPEGPHHKSIVHQSRHLWTLSRAGLRFPQNITYSDGAEHGFRFIADHSWNHEYGGFYSEVNRKGLLLKPGLPFIAFGQSFAMYGIMAYHSLSHNPEALKLAIDTFHWLEEYMYDPENKGYYSFLDREKNITERPDYTACLNGPCMKGINSILHILEAYLELYKAWPDALLYARLSELLDILEEKIIQPRGYIHTYFDKDWTPIRIKRQTKSNVRKYIYLDHVSFGHDAEAAFLMQEAALTLKLKNQHNTNAITKKLVDHSIIYGVDRWKGGVYGKGYYFNHRKKPICLDKNKYWWVQAEMLYALLLMWSLYPDDEQNYFALFQRQWSYIKTYCLDNQNGGWFECGTDKSPKKKMHPKSYEWKSTYHTYRALENCILLLDRMLTENNPE